MRFFLISLLSLVGCTDYQIVSQDEEREIIDTGDTGIIEETGQSMECGFEIISGVQVYVQTHSMLTYKLVSHETLDVKVGEPIEVTFAFTAHPCGSVLLSGMVVILSDPQSKSWVDDIAAADVASTMELADGDQRFQPNSGYEVPTVTDALYYHWGENQNDRDFEMDPLIIEASETVYYTFTLDGTHFAKEGDRGEIWLSQTSWQDLATSKYTNDIMYWKRQGGSWEAGAAYTTFKFYE